MLFLGLARINLDLNPIQVSKIQTENLQKLWKTTSNVLHQRFEATSLQSTPGFSTCPCQSVRRWWWMPNMVILNIRCILTCLLLTPGQQINLYTYCPDLHGQDGTQGFYEKKNQTEKSNSFGTIKVPFVSNVMECPVGRIHF